jgi:hypothetical protein
MQARDRSSSTEGRLASLSRKAERLDCKTIKLTCPLTSNCSSQVATSLWAQTVPECDGEARFDFIPSRVLLSAALQLDRSQLERVELDLGKIGRDDPLLWHHPMLTDESSGTREWFMGGRQTPGE